MCVIKAENHVKIHVCSHATVPALLSCLGFINICYLKVKALGLQWKMILIWRSNTLQWDEELRSMWPGDSGSWSNHRNISKTGAAHTPCGFTPCVFFATVTDLSLTWEKCKHFKINSFSVVLDSAETQEALWVSHKLVACGKTQGVRKTGGR